MGACNFYCKSKGKSASEAFNEAVKRAHRGRAREGDAMTPLNVLVGCERSGIVREAFRRLGHNAWSCDLEPAEDGSPYHAQEDIEDLIGCPHWDIAIVHPPCTFLSVSGLHWNKRRPERAAQTEESLRLIRVILDTKAYANGRANPLMLALENPVGCISTRIRRPDQVIQPYQFGDDASKATCLWLVGLPPLRPTGFVEPRIVNGKPRWSNQTDSGQNRLGPSPTRQMDRARTYPGIAQAMAKQWAQAAYEARAYDDEKEKIARR